MYPATTRLRVPSQPNAATAKPQPADTKQPVGNPATPTQPVAVIDILLGTRRLDVLTPSPLARDPDMSGGQSENGGGVATSQKDQELVAVSVLGALAQPNQPHPYREDGAHLNGAADYQRTGSDTHLQSHQSLQPQQDAGRQLEGADSHVKVETGDLNAEPTRPSSAQYQPMYPGSLSAAATTEMGSLPSLSQLHQQHTYQPYDSQQQLPRPPHLPFSTLPAPIMRRADTSQSLPSVSSVTANFYSQQQQHQLQPPQQLPYTTLPAPIMRRTSTAQSSDPHQHLQQPFPPRPLGAPPNVNHTGSDPSSASTSRGLSPLGSVSPSGRSPTSASQPSQHQQLQQHAQLQYQPQQPQQAGLPSHPENSSHVYYPVHHSLQPNLLQHQQHDPSQPHFQPYTTLPTPPIAHHLPSDPHYTPVHQQAHRMPPFLDHRASNASDLSASAAAATAAAWGPSPSGSLSPTSGAPPATLHPTSSTLSTASRASSNGGGPSNNKVYRCPEPGCEKTFTRRYNLQSHLRCHSGERPFRCDFCPATFSRKHDLRRHTRSLHSEERPHLCMHCSLSFARSDALKRHLAAEGKRAGGNHPPVGGSFVDEGEGGDLDGNSE
ncbi:Metallothionein expression activator [Irineochytrium annulatum]|nr:Metallothionein expression activator [Irineochytrium annulatum]